MALNNFNTAMFQANLLYGTDFNDSSDFEEMGLIAHSLIGTKHLRFYRYVGKVDPVTLSIDLPCNCDEIEAVTIPPEDWTYADGIHWNGDIISSFNEEYSEARKHFKDPLYLRGKYIHYERIGDKIYVQHPFPKVLILYEGEMLDDEGLPFLNDKEVQAIACYVAYVMKFKEGLATNNTAIIQQAQFLKNEWNRFCDAARVPEHLDQNDANDILDVKSSFMRKTYGRSFKPAMK